MAELKVSALGGSISPPTSAAYPVVIRSGATTTVAAEPVEIVRANGADALQQFDALTPGWWAGFFSYDLGRSIEWVNNRDSFGADILQSNLSQSSVPDLILARYDARWVSNGVRSHFEGSNKAVARLEKLITNAPLEPEVPDLVSSSSSLNSEEFTEGVRKILNLIDLGECYQVNLSRQLSWDQVIDPRSLYRALSAANPAPHSSLLILPNGDETISVVSASPESFLTWSTKDSKTTVKTRPIKGTGRDAHSLGASAKDRAENVMIVDLARNDLGRVCDFGSIHVPDLCSVEEHPGLWHLVSTVQGTSSKEVRPGDLLRATFPPASVTGAPKPGVLQIIEDLEPVRRGIYCGAIGWVDTQRHAGDLSVAIRTFVAAGKRTTLGVGGGIVADSDPDSEWQETELKAARILSAVGARDVGIAV